MSEPGRPGRTTVLLGLLLALLLAAAYAIVSSTSTPPRPGPEPPPPPFPTVATPTVPPDTPRAGQGYPTRRVAALQANRSVLVNGRGNAELRYRRAPGNGTRVHFICTGCDADTWLVELPRGVPVGGGALADPEDVTWAIDTVSPGGTTSLLVKAPAAASWTATLTPFDAIPVHEQTFDALGDDVVAVRATHDLQLTCGGASFGRALARERNAPEFDVLQVWQDDQAGTHLISAPVGSDLVVLMVSCPGRWTVTV